MRPSMTADVKAALLGRPPTNALAEGVVLFAVCSAPWMIGSVDAWAALVLNLCAGVVALIASIPYTGFRSRRWLSLPSLAISGLALLATFQAMSLPPRVLGSLSPAAGSSREALLPDRPDRILGDPQPPVPTGDGCLSLDPGLTRSAAARLAGAWLLFQGVVSLGGGYASLRRLAWAVAINAALLSLFSIVQALTWNGKIYWYFPTSAVDRWSGGGPFVSHTHLAEYLNLGLGLALGLLFSEGSGQGGRSSRVWTAYLVGVLILGVVFSHSRGGFVAMTGMLVFILAGGGLRQRVGVGAVAAVALPALFLVALGETSFTTRLSTILDPSERGYAVRAEAWRLGLLAWRGRPFFGTGLGTFAVAVEPLQTEERPEFFAHAENEYLELLACGGLIGCVLGALGLLALSVRSWVAVKSATGPSERPLAWCACGALLALLINCLSDFGLHVPGVGIPAVVLAAYLTRLGTPKLEASSGARSWRLARVAILLAVSAAVIARGVNESRAEALMRLRGLPPPDMELLLSPALPDWERELLEGDRDAIREALAAGPDWSEGYLRLGLTELALYRDEAEVWLSSAVSDPEERRRLADPLWLLTIAREGPEGALPLAEQEPVRRHIVPAVRAFMEARRRQPTNPLAHAELGAIAWILSRENEPGVHIRRALSTAGPRSGLLLFTAETSLRAGDLTLATTGWRKALQARPGNWLEIADLAGPRLDVETLVSAVIPADRGSLALQFADRLFSDPAERPAHERLLRVAAETSKLDTSLSPAGRMHAEAVARHGLGERKASRARLEAALVLDPGQAEWREKLVTWLLASGEALEAHNQALIGLRLSPDRPEARDCLERAVEALARGDATVGGYSP